jgi:hypothetical protein
MIIVSSMAEATSEYQKRVNELSVNGWDQGGYQRLLDWYHDQIKRFASGFPLGN